MKPILITVLVCATVLITATSFAKRPKHKPKQSTSQETEEQKESHPYQPNPVVLAGVGQIMNGALAIAQDPHNRPNIGHSVASMIHGIITIIIEKLARKNMSVVDWQVLEECYNEVCSDVNREIANLMETVDPQ